VLHKKCIIPANSIIIPELLKIKDSKTPNGDYKKQPNKAIDTVQLN